MNTTTRREFSSTDVFIERMNRKFQLQGTVFPKEEQAAWARQRWGAGAVVESSADATPVCWYFDAVSPSTTSVYRDSDLLDQVMRAKTSPEFAKSVVMVWNWQNLVSPGEGGDYPAAEEVESEFEGRRNYLVADGNLWISEPPVRPGVTQTRVPKVKISSRYLEEEEVRTDERPYQAYLSALETVVNFSKINSFCDVGCATGLLLKAVKERHKHVQVHGYEYFQFHKENAPASVQQNIQIHDLRDPVHDTNTTWDVVNCTEVGEHIDPAYCDQFIENLRTLCGYRSHLVSEVPRKTVLLLSWSAAGGENDREHDPRLQHLHPLQPDQVDAMMRSKSFVKADAATARFLEESVKHEHFLPWWRTGFGIWIPTWNAARMY